MHGEFRPPVHADRYRYSSDAPYRYFRRGDRAPRSLLLGGAFIADFLALGLTSPPPQAHWVRFGPDALLIDSATGDVLDTVYGVYDDGTPAPPPASATAEQLYDNWNTGACDFTDTAVLDVEQPLYVDRIELWLNWYVGEQSVNYRVYRDGEDIGGGVLQRTGCDPYQSAWCGASDSPASDLQPGHYEFRIDHPALCQNRDSNGAGFIRVWGY